MNKLMTHSQAIATAKQFCMDWEKNLKQLGSSSYYNLKWFDDINKKYIGIYIHDKDYTIAVFDYSL